MTLRYDWTSAELNELEALAAEVLETTEAREACEAVAARWRAHVRPDTETEALFEEELRQAAFCAALRAVNCNPNQPKLHVIGRFPHAGPGGGAIPGSNYGHGNPDTLYRLAPVEPGARYRLSGQFPATRPTATEISLVDDQQNFLGNITSRALQVDADGSFSVLLDPDAADLPGAALRNVPGAYNLCVRDVLGDVAHECPPLLSVERLDPSTRSSSPDPRSVFHGLLRQAVEEIIGFENAALRPQAANVFSTPTVRAEGLFLPSQAFSFGHYAIDDETALVLRLSGGGASYFVVPATNPWGGLGKDFLSRCGSLNRFQAEPDADGSYSLVLSLTDPGYANWIDPGGVRCGVVVARWIDFESRSVPSPSLQASRVKLAELDATLGEGVRRTDREARAQALVARREAYLGVKG